MYSEKIPVWFSDITPTYVDFSAWFVIIDTFIDLWCPAIFHVLCSNHISFIGVSIYLPSGFTSSFDSAPSLIPHMFAQLFISNLQLHLCGKVTALWFLSFLFNFCGHSPRFKVGFCLLSADLVYSLWFAFEYWAVLFKLLLSVL